MIKIHCIFYILLAKKHWSCWNRKVKWPAPLAWTTLSGILSRLKCAISSVKTKSWRRTGPRGPTVIVAVFRPTGAPVPVVNTSSFWNQMIVILWKHICTSSCCKNTLIAEIYRYDVIYLLKQNSLRSEGMIKPKIRIELTVKCISSCKKYCQMSGIWWQLFGSDNVNDAQVGQHVHRGARFFMFYLPLGSFWTPSAAQQPCHVLPFCQLCKESSAEVNLIWRSPGTASYFM